jgi:hypothetical protein
MTEVTQARPEMHARLGAVFPRRILKGPVEESADRRFETTFD